MSCSSQREEELARQGWKRQFMASEPRLSEAIEEYQELGFEVRLEEVDPATCARGGPCAACFQEPATAARHKVIFTRRAAMEEQENNS